MQTDTCRTVVKEKALLWVLIGIENSESKFAGREMHPAKCVCNVKLEPLTGLCEASGSAVEVVLLKKDTFHHRNAVSEGECGSGLLNDLARCVSPRVPE